MTLKQPIPTVSIIFPTISHRQTQACLQSLAKLAYPKSKLEIIVVNNGNNALSSTIKQKPPYLKIISNHTNLGFSRAVNQGIRKAKGEYVFITNDDVSFDPNSLTRLITYAIKNPQASVVSGQVITTNQNPAKVTFGYRMHPWTGHVTPIKSPQMPRAVRSGESADFFEGKPSSSALTEGKHPPKKTSSSQKEQAGLPFSSPILLGNQKNGHITWIPGCAMLVKRSVFKTIGLLDTGFPHFFEDVDFCLRATRAGLQLAIVPNAKFWHQESSTGNQNLSKKYTLWYQSKIRFILKNLPLVNIFSLLTIQLLFITPLRALFLHDGRLVPFVKGIWRNIKNNDNY